MMSEDTDDKDDTKRRSRNLSEKKRRDQFNMLINELSSIVSTTNRKMDKSTVLKSTIAFLKNHNELAVRSRAHEIQEDWKPSFLSNEEFTHLILEAVDGFIIVFSSRGQIVYVSGSVTSLLGHLPTELMNGSMTMYDVVYEEDQATLYNILSNCSHGMGKENQMEFSCHVRRGDLDYRDEPVYELVHFVGHFRTDIDNSEVDNVVSSTNRYSGDVDSVLVFVGTARLETPQLIREMTISDASKTEFTSRHNLDWKFLSLDSRATPIIGYVQLEVVGTSGYDYYHIDDLDKIVTCHEALMEKGEGTSCHYRFLTKGQQWVWLQSRFYISYHQWNSKPEFIVCTHRVVTYVDVMIQARKDPNELNDAGMDGSGAKRGPFYQWGSKSSSAGKLMEVTSPDQEQSKSRSRGYHGTDSPAHSQVALSVRSRGQSSSVGHPPAPKQPSPLSPAQASTTYIEPQHQYVTAIPLQPIIAAFPSAAVVTSLPTPEILRPPQSNLQDHLKRKQDELHRLRLLMAEKEEEIQQFVMSQTRYGIIPSIINVPGGAVSSTTSQAADMYVQPHSLGASSTGRSHQVANSPSDMHQFSLRDYYDLGVVPLQFSEQQAQLLFATPMSQQAPNSTT